MAPKKRRSGRAVAEAAYTDLMREFRTLVGDVGASHEALVTSLEATLAAQKRYEDHRAAAIKSGAVSSDQLDAMGFRRTPKIPTVTSAAADPASAGGAPETPSPSAPKSAAANQ